MLKTEVPNGFPISLRHTWLLVNRPRTYTAWLREQFGKAVTFFNVTGDAFVVVLTPEGARQVFAADPDGFDAFWKEGFGGVAGSGSIWVLGGNEHRRERQLLAPAFHGRSFQGYGEVIREITCKQTAQWQPGQELRALDSTLAISLEVIMRLVFGVVEGEFVAEGRRVLYDLWKNLNPTFVFFPWLQRSWFPPWRRYQRAKHDFTRWIDGYLRERKSRREESNDILGRMLAACYEDGSPMRDEDIRDELITILLAGHETTATALAWALYDLGMNPAELEKLRTELGTLGPDPDPGAVVKLPYLTAVCNETLRLHTLLPEVARVLAEPLPLLGYTIPAQGAVGVSVMAIHHDPELYPEPDRFNPERFVGRSYSPYEFLPFGGGHRRCLGAGLSDYEMRIALAQIVTDWELEPAAVEREIRHDIAMGPKNGVRLHVKGRRFPRRKP